jgi:hypothetical protein
MTVLTVKRRLDTPIPGFPEFAQMIGKNVEITIAEGALTQAYEFWNGPSAAELAIQLDVAPVTSIEQLRGDKDLAGALDGFEEAVDRWRHEPWRTGDK